MRFTGLDLNADRLWCLSGTAGKAPIVDRLEGEQAEVPLALALDERTVQVGRPGLTRCRKSPHVVCMNFLPKMGEHVEWAHGRHRLDPLQALGLVFDRVCATLGERKSLVLAVPAYLSNEQVNLIVQAALEARLPVIGALSRTLGAGASSYADHPWQDLGVAVDIDEHALTISVLRPSDADLVVLGQKVLPALGLRIWRERLMAAIADRCVRTSRRDPRESPDADQMVFEQLDRVFETCSQGRPATLEVQGAQWYQTLTLQPQDATTACAAIARQTAVEIQAALQWAREQHSASSIYFLAGVGRLPGLAAVVYELCENRVPVSVLPSSAAARAAFELAQRIDEGELAPGFYGSAVPLPRGDRQDVPQTIPFPERGRATKSRG